MESDGGMVAIVQASKHAGLTVTVLPDKHRCCKRKYVVLDMGKGVKTTRSCKSNVETNTEWMSKNSSTPPWELRYDSGYQFANCLRRPSSQQRSLYHRVPHHMVSFMQSLRQYPEVTSSDDFIQGILDYTCTKNHNKKLWRRSLLRKSTSQHTYRVGKKLENSPTHKMNTSSRRRLDRSASVIGRRHSSQEEVLNYTYDYLKSTSLIHRRTDVRYLTEMKRAVKDRLREMIECRSTVCPKMQSRYLLHKRHCGSPKHTSDVATNITETLVPTDSKDVPHLAHGSSYTSPKHSLQKSCFCQPRTPCVCKKSHDLKVLNEIKDWINDIPVYPNFSEADKIKQDQMLKELTNTLKELLKESNFNFKAKKEILKFLKALPMWHPSDPQEDALFKEKLAENLIEKFGKAAEAILEEEIAKEIENLPLDSKYINRQDIKRMTDKFLEKLKPIAVNRPRDEKEYEEVLKSELLNLLEDVPLKYDSQKPETKSKIADKFANRLRTIKLPASKKTTTIQQEHGTERNVSEIVKDIPELSDLNASKQKELTQFLKDKMGDYDLKNLDDRQAQQEVQKKLNEWIDNSQISGRLDSKTKDKLTKKIMQELRAGVKSDDEDTLGLLKNWVQGILELSGGDETENKKYLQDLATKLNEIQLSDVDPENTQLGMRETITDWLQNMLKSNRKKLSFTTQENLVNELMKKVNDTTKQRRYMEREDPNIIYGDVIEWIKNIPGIDSNIVLDQSNVIDDLMNTLNDIRNNSDEGLAETQTTDAINNFVEHLSETMGVKIDPKKQKVLEQKLLEKNNKAPQQKKHWKKQSGYSERFSYTPDMSLTRDLIKKWTQGLKLSGGDRMENNKAVQDLATQLDEIQTSGEDPENIQIDMKETIADWLQNMLRKNNRKLSTGTQENLVSELVKNINNSPKQRRHMQIRDPNIIYDDLVEWIKDIPGMGSDIDLNQSNEIEDLMNTLKDLRNNSDEELVETQTKVAINSFAERLSENTDVKIDPKNRKVLEQKLLEKMKQAPQQRKHWTKQNSYATSTTKTHALGRYSQSPTRDLVKNWAQNLQLSGSDRMENKNAVQDLATQLDEIQTSGEDPENIQIVLKETIADWLQNILRKNYRRLSIGTQENLVSELVKNINDAPKQLRYTQTEDPNIIHDDVAEWITDIPGIDSNIDLDQSNGLEDLMNTLNDIRNNSDEEFVETQAKEAINNFVEHFYETTGVKIDPKKQKVLEQNLLEKMNKPPQQKKHWKKQNGYSERYSCTPDMSLTSDLIKKWTQGLKLSGGDRIENKKAVQDLATQLDEIQTSGEDPENIQIDMKETIADWLQNMLRKNNRKLSTGTQENLVSELVNNINNAPKQRRYMQRKDPNIIYDDLVEWIKDIPGMGSDIDLDKSNAIEDLMNTLNDIRNNSDEELVETQTTDAINHFFEHLSETIGVEIDPKQRRILEQNFLEKIKQAPHQRKQNGYGPSTPKVQASGRYSQSPDLSLTRDLIKKWAHHLELSGHNRMDIQKALQELATQLDEIKTSDENPDNIQIRMKETVADWLQNMLRKNNRRLSIGTQENLVSELVKNISDAPKQRSHMQREDPNIMYDDVAEWITDIPGMGSTIDLDQSNALEDLMNRLNDIRNNSDEGLAETQTRNAINNFVEQLSETTGVKIDPKKRKVLEQKLLEKMKQAPQQTKHWNKQNRFGSSTPKPYAEGFSIPPDLSPIRDVSVLDRQSEIDEYMSTLNNLIGSWMKRLELTIDSAEQKNLVSVIASDIVDRHKYLQISNNKTTEADELDHLKYQIFRRLNKFNVEDLPRILSKATDLNKALVSIKAPELTKPLNRFDLERNINNIVNSLKTWLDNVPSDLARPYNEPYSDEVFMDLAKKLAEHRDSINHYNMKNEILQWIPKLFTNLSTNALNNIADSLKNHMMNDLAQSLAQDETAGLMYRQMLWDTISKTLPSIHMTSADDLHTFDLLKERLVDAFINLHYFANDMVALDKFKTKLFNEVNKFCNEYLRRYPESPMNSEEIGKNLYSALRQVSVPDLETVKSELEQVRLKEDILDWLPDVPLDMSKNIEPEINAMASSLAKRLRGLEKEKQLDPNKDDEMKQEITKWLQNLPLRNQLNLQDFADKLMDKLKSTDKSRTLSASKIGKYDDNIAPTRRSLNNPQSRLSVEDRAHLDRIRRRLDYSRGNRSQRFSKDASISPPPRESVIQTEMDGRLEGTVQTGPSMYERCNMVNRGVSPQVIIKEYYWDSTGSNISVRERTSDARRACSPCSPCSKATQTIPQVIRTCQRTKDSNTEQAIVTYPRTQEDKICDKRSCNLGTLADRNSCIPPPSYVPEDKQINQRTNLPSAITRPKSKVDYFPEDKRTYQINWPSETNAPRSKIDNNCCNCGQRIYTKCRGRHRAYRPHCNLSCLKYCPKLNSGCPYPSNLYFRKEF